MIFESEMFFKQNTEPTLQSKMLEMLEKNKGGGDDHKKGVTD
jgi:hypothetical protein